MFYKSKITINPVVSLILLLAFLTAGCEQVNDLYTDSREVTKEVSFDSYNSIWTYGVFNIRLVEDTVCKAVVKGKRSIVKNLTFKQERRKIIVREEQTNKWARGTEKPVLEFHFKRLRYFRIEEPASLESLNTLHSRHLEVIAANELSRVDLTMDVQSFYMENWSTNTGVYELSGNCGNFHVKLCGSGELRAEKLKTKNARIEQQSIANGYLSVNDTLRVFSSNEGDVYYSGEPEKIVFKKQASGKLIKMH
jgi:hypothetical protein